MTRGFAKVAVSLPQELLDAVDELRQARGDSRSAVFQEALRQWLQRQTEEELDRKYLEGYRRRPETAREIEEASELAARAFRDRRR